MIEADRLVKRYGAFQAVKGVSFRVKRGEIVGLLGPNGAGKTSIMRILTCYHFPTAGTARVDSHDVLEEPHQVRRQVGYLPEDAPLYHDMKVGEYLAFIAEVRGLGGRQKGERLEIAAQACGITGVLGRDVHRLSKGYRQRVGLAQAIIHDPRVLVLDEPTAGLDPNQILEVRALIRSLGARKTVVLSTHILQEVEAVCSRVLIMNAGTLVAQGTAEEIARELPGGLLLSVTFKGRLTVKTAQSLQELPGVRGLAGLRPAGAQRTEVDLVVGGQGDPSEAVYDWALERGIKILGMKTGKSNLEQLFARLTGGGGRE